MNKIIDEFGLPGCFNVLIECEKGSCEKWEYNWEKGEMEKDFVFKDGFFWPFYYGEILGTLGGDGDRLDAMVFSNQNLKRGEIVKCKTLGFVEILDRGERDDKFICVISDDEFLVDVKNKEFQEKIIKLYLEIARQKEKVMEILAFHGENEAKVVVEQSVK